MVSTQPAITVEQLARINAADPPAQVVADLCNQPAGTSARRSILTRLGVMLSRQATWEAQMERLETHLRRTGEQHE